MTDALIRRREGQSPGRARASRGWHANHSSNAYRFFRGN